MPDIVETKIADEEPQNEEIMEISNIEKCMSFIDDNVGQAPINRLFLSELHRLVVKNLTEEGSGSPGEYRRKNIIIAGADHVPPDFCQIDLYMQELFDFIRQDVSPKYDLIKTALVHHRFVWIHPFDNGNGRTVRLLTYAMLINQGFNVDKGRIINPTAVFCSDRNKYYKALNQADIDGEYGLLAWCEYVLKGLKQEIEKIDHLLDYGYLKKIFCLQLLIFH